MSLGLPPAGAAGRDFLRVQRSGGDRAWKLPRCRSAESGVPNPPQVIYVARNPKDVVVSFYYFHRLAKFLPDPVSFDAFLQQFLEGTGKGWEGPGV